MHDRLRRARLLAGFDTAKAAIERFGWKASTYRAHENGQNRFGAGEAGAYAYAYKISSAWLLFGEQDPSLPAGDKEKTPSTPADPRGHALISCALHACPPAQSDHFDLSLDVGELDDIGCRGDVMRFAPVADHRALLDGDIVAVKRRTESGVEIVPGRVFFRHGQTLFAPRRAARVELLANARILGKAIWLLRPLG